MSSYSTRLIGSEPIADQTLAFHFEKPPEFNFRAGQAVDLILPQVDENGEPARHAFSLVSTPGEDRLTIATRLRRSRYKDGLRALAPGAAVLFEGPFGSLTLHNDAARDAVMIAGGIGITPFVSIIRHAVQQHPVRHLVVVYSNRRVEDAAYLNELQTLAGDYPGLNVIPTLTRSEAVPPAWAGHIGKIDGTLLTGITTRSPIYYLAGPPAFVETMQASLLDSGTDESDIRREGFYGY